MKTIYDYQNNINIITTPNGDKVITMNEEILTTLRLCVFDAAEHYKKDNLDATANDIMKLWKALNDK